MEVSSPIARRTLENRSADQQEKALACPEYVQTYVLLGEPYEKGGQADDARQIWPRGLALFPDHSSLKDKLAKLP